MKPASTRRTIYYHSRAILRALRAEWRDWLRRNWSYTDPEEDPKAIRDLAQRVARTIPKPPRGWPIGVPRVQAWTFPTGHGSELGWHVHAHDETEAAEILAQSPLFRVSR